MSNYTRLQSHHAPAQGTHQFARRYAGTGGGRAGTRATAGCCVRQRVRGVFSVLNCNRAQQTICLLQG